MNRTDAVKCIMGSVTNQLVISSAGKISREVFNIKDRPENFYVQGSMGAALGIGIGVAMTIPLNRKVIVIAGDGESLMNLGTLALMKKLNLPNLDLFILDNNQYQSTGEQKTISDAIDFRTLCNCRKVSIEDGGSEPPRINIPCAEITRRFMDAVQR